MVRKVAVEAEKKTRKIKVAVQPARGILHPRIFMLMIGGISSTQMDGLVSSFQSEEINSMVAKAMGEFALASAEVAHEDPGEQAPMGFMAEGGDTVQKW